MDPALQELIDKQAIGDVLQRYSRTLDWLDDDAQSGCYWPDAEVDYGFFKGRAAEFLPIVMEVERGSDRRWHMLSQPLIAFQSPTSASSECYGIFAGSKRQEDGTLAGNLYGGRYLDEWEKRDAGGGDEWRISSRTYLLDWQSDLTDQPGFEPNPDFPLPTAKISESGHPLYRPL
ncbi:nuclear transport factor 2 family protein [uncultured Erythrobacter sp.]|uniref:nuclear transport factor 2 family protein n=1 Tax=uncultured Erythrobacter sp. TaxID=263913 RepID=UPI002631C23D|nr:nuclear transport factor 2 family protein [uncultured Erythrobacter sp.]